MKNNKIFVWMLIAAVIFCGCEYNSNIKYANSLGNFPYNSNIDQLSIVEIDSCEYIVCNAFKRKDITITHKGNCKFCKNRK